MFLIPYPACMHDLIAVEALTHQQATGFSCQQKGSADQNQPGNQRSSRVEIGIVEFVDQPHTQSGNDYADQYRGAGGATPISMLMLIWATAGIATEPKVIIAHSNMFRVNIIPSPVCMITRVSADLPASAGYKSNDVLPNSITYRCDDYSPFRGCAPCAGEHT